MFNSQKAYLSIEIECEIFNMDLNLLTVIKLVITLQNCAYIYNLSTNSKYLPFQSRSTCAYKYNYYSTVLLLLLFVVILISTFRLLMESTDT